MVWAKPQARPIIMPSGQGKVAFTSSTATPVIWMCIWPPINAPTSPIHKAPT